MFHMFRKQEPIDIHSPAEAERLLKTIRRSVIEDPVALEEELAQYGRQIDAADAEFDRLSTRRDSGAFLDLQPLAERLRDLRARARRLPARIASARNRETAFLALARRYGALTDDVQARLDALIDHPLPDDDARAAAIRELDEVVRLHYRVALQLQSVSEDPSFSEPPDAIRMLKGILEERILELDRLRTPGLKPRFVAPPDVASLIEAVQGRTSQREHAHA